MSRFEILSEIRDIETSATGRGVYIRRYRERTYGKGRWRKMKGTATVQLADGTICEAEIHWFEAHGIAPNEQDAGNPFILQSGRCLSESHSPNPRRALAAAQPLVRTSKSRG